MTNKWSWKNTLFALFAIVISCGLWMFVDEQQGRTCQVTLTDIPIDYQSAALADRGLMLVEGEGSETSASLNLTLEGSRRSIAKLDKAKMRVTADLSSISVTGLQTVSYQVSYADRRFFENNITRKEASIYMATVDIQELNSKYVEVRCELVGNVAENCSAGKVQLSQPSLEIRGQAADLEQVSYAKVVLDIGRDADESIYQELEYKFYNSDNQVVEPQNLYQTVQTIHAALPIFVTKELELVVNYTESEGARLRNTQRTLTPSSVLVSGDASVMKKVDSIVLGDVNLLDLQDGVATYSFPIVLPDNCQNLSNTSYATLKISFEDQVSRELTATSFGVENGTGEQETTILTEALTIRVFGTERDISELVDEDVRVIADLTNYSAASGTYMVPARVEIGGSGDVGIQGSYEVKVTIMPADLVVPEEEIVQQ